MTVAQKAPCRLGTHRVIEPAGALPQAAWRIDATPHAHANEILCDVETLNIDSASFRQIASVCDGDPARIAEHIVATVRERGKQHNPVTGSGGMFVGRVAAIGEALRDRVALREGDPIASLVSLTLTPLSIDAVERVNVETGRVWLRGSAILFESGIYAKLPDDIPRDVALAVLNVAGAPAQVARLARHGQTVVVIGADGKSGLLASAQAKRNVGPSGRVIGIGPDPATTGARLLVETGIADAFLGVDATRTLNVVAAMATQPGLADLVVNCVNVPGTELSSILCARDEGTVYFFSMNTSFSAAALGAEGIGKDVTMVIGNGYTKGHADLALQTLRDHPALLRYFTDRYGGRPQS